MVMLVPCKLQHDLSDGRKGALYTVLCLGSAVLLPRLCARQMELYSVLLALHCFVPADEEAAAANERALQHIRNR